MWYLEELGTADKLKLGDKGLNVYRMRGRPFQLPMHVFSTLLTNC